jgi:hypothetical protein
MSKTGSMDCPKCKKWIAECDCEQNYYDNSGDAIDAAMREMTEEQQQEMQAECSEHFAAIPF